MRVESRPTQIVRRLAWWKSAQPSWLAGAVLRCAHRHLALLCLLPGVVPCAQAAALLPQPPGQRAALKGSSPASSTLRARLPVLTTVEAVHRLSAEEAARAYPVHLSGVITFRDPHMEARHTALFVHDATGSLYIDAPPGITSGNAAPGKVIDVEGVTDPGGFRPIVRPSRIRVAGSAPLPRVSRSTPYRPTNRDGWIEVRGVVQAVLESRDYIRIELAMLDGTITAKTLREPGAAYTGLVDARVRIRANSSPLYNRSHQMVGARLLFPGLAALKVIEAAPPDPFSVPVHAIDRLFRFRMGEALEHRVHLRGQVTLQWPGALLCIRDATGGLCAQTAAAEPAEVGTLVDLAGFAAMGDVAPVLTHTIYQRAPAGLPASKAGGGAPVPAETITAVQAMLGAQDSRLIQIEGKLLGRDRAAKDLTLVLSSGNIVFNAILPRALEGQHGSEWKDGSRLHLTGICAVQSNYEETSHGDGLEVPRAFRILLRFPADVMVRASPSWWSTGHLLRLLGVLGAVFLAVTLWGVMLRRRVQQQTAMLRESEEKFRYLASHDGLTRLPNRNAILAELKASLEQARDRNTCVCVAMLDLDHFKQINDTHGHNGGDEVLREAARRLAACARDSDAIGRYGGEEFLMVFRNKEQRISIERCEQVRHALCCEPVCFAGKKLAISCSIGISTNRGSDDTAALLIAQADDALYRAKANGRNRVEVFGPAHNLPAHTAPSR